MSEFANDRGKFLIAESPLGGFVGFDKLFNPQLRTTVLYLGVEIFRGQFADNYSLELIVGKLRQCGVINLENKALVVD